MGLLLPRWKNLTNSVDPLLKNILNRGPLKVTPTVQRPTNKKNYLNFKKSLNKCNEFVTKGKGKGKTIPLEAWTGPETSRRMRLPDFKTIGT